MKTFGVVARVKAPEGYRGVWVNIYNPKYTRAFQFGGSYLARNQADNICKEWRYDCIYVHVRIDGTRNNRL